MPSFILGLLTACAPEPATCAEGFDLRADGLCYEVVEPPVEDTDVPPPPTLMDWLDTLQACEPLAGDGRLDLAAGCVEGLCAGDGYADAMAARPGAACEVYIEGFIFECVWERTGLSAWVYDVDGDDVMDPNDPLWMLNVDLPYLGSTSEGLGLGADMKCFIDVLGEPDEINVARSDDAWQILSMSYGDVSISDYVTNKNQDYASDGLADGITFYSDL